MMERGTSYSLVGSQNNQVTSYRSLTLFLSLWHVSCHPNRFCEASSEISKDSRKPREAILEIVKEKHDNATFHNYLY